jgi:hypothetical protein
MRFIRIFSITAITVAAATASISVATATATQSTGLCKSNVEVLACSNLATEIHAVAEEPLLHTSIVDVKCKESLARATVLTLATPQVLHLSELTWKSCKTHGGTNCTVATLLLGLLTALKLNTTDAHVQSTGGTAVLVSCGEFIHCVYAGEPVLLAEGAPADLKANTTVNGVATHGEKLFCPSTSTWLALYGLQALSISISVSDVYIRG